LFLQRAHPHLFADETDNMHEGSSDADTFSAPSHAKLHHAKNHCSTLKTWFSDVKIRHKMKLTLNSATLLWCSPPLSCLQKKMKQFAALLPVTASIDF